MAKFYTVRGHKNGKLEFASIGITKSEAIELRKDIIKRKRTPNGSWAKGMKFTIQEIKFIPDVE